MKTPSTHKLISVTLGGVFLLLASGCAVTTDGGYGGYPYVAAPNVGVGLGLGLDYYNDGPFGFDYGGWGPGYGVGPYYRRGGDARGHGDDHSHGDFRPHGGGILSGHSFRPAAPSRPMPSIPSGSHFGGDRGGDRGGGRR